MLSMLSDELPGHELDDSLLEAVISGGTHANSSNVSLSSRPVHLCLTDYGPESATDYLRANPQILRQFSCICGRRNGLHQPDLQSQSRIRSRDERFHDVARKQRATKSQQLRRSDSMSSAENKQDIQKSSRTSAPSFDGLSFQTLTEPGPSTVYARGQPSSNQDYVPKEHDVFTENNSNIQKCIPGGLRNNFRPRDHGAHVQRAFWTDSESEDDYIDFNGARLHIFKPPLLDNLGRSSSEFAGYSKIKRKGGRGEGMDFEDTRGANATSENLPPSTSSIGQLYSRSPVQDHQEGKGKASALVHNQGRIELPEAAEALRSESHREDNQKNDAAAEYGIAPRLPALWHQDLRQRKAPWYEPSLDTMPDPNRAEASGEVRPSAFHDSGTSLDVVHSEVHSATLCDVRSPNELERESWRSDPNSPYQSEDLAESSFLVAIKAPRMAAMASFLDKASPDSSVTSRSRPEFPGKATSQSSASPLQKSTQSESRHISMLQSKKKTTKPLVSPKTTGRMNTNLQGHINKLKPSATGRSETREARTNVRTLPQSEVNDPFPELNLSQRQSSRPIDYKHLLCTATGGIKGAEASNQVELGSSLNDRSRCIHQNSAGSNSPYVSIRLAKKGWPPNVPQDILLEIVMFLSFEDLKNLRLVNKTFAAQLFDIQFQSVVFRFGPEMFQHRIVKSGSPLQDRSIFQALGKKIQKFGMAFEIDLNGLYYAQPKKNISTEDAFWGSYKWPGSAYPRFRQLHNLEELADNIKYLKTAMSCLTEASELGLSLDTGHGWLAGADQSDMAVYESRSKKSSIFKSRFPANRNHFLLKRILFESAQMKTYQCIAKRIGVKSNEWRKDLRSHLPIRSLLWFKDNDEEDEELRDARHTGSLLHILEQRDRYNNFGQDFASAIQPQLNPGSTNRHTGYSFPINPLQPGSVRNVPLLQSHMRQGLMSDTTIDTVSRQSPQGPDAGRRSFNFPLIFNGHNLRDGAGGCSSIVKDEVHSPEDFPLKPNNLTEPQAQWLLETAWAQRAFLASYVTAVVSNKAILGPNIHSLHITKISSGLLHNLADKEFWVALPKLQTVTLLVIPDWRRETYPCEDTYDQPEALIPPYTASLHFKDFLETYVAPLENVSKLTVGFASGGEHATGMLARNNHVLPAPLTSDPKNWLVARENGASPDPDAPTMVSFEHVTSLTICNAWITPHMLRTFMKCHHDTSLKSLVLDSVSLTTQHSLRPRFIRLGCNEDGHKPLYGPADWLHETLPTRDCWPALLDDITPAQTFKQKKQAAWLVGSKELSEEPSFRGNIDRIVLKSCGYVHITGGVNSEDYNQASLVLPTDEPMDPGLVQLRCSLECVAMVSGDPLNANPMMNHPVAWPAPAAHGNPNQQQNNNNPHAGNAAAAAAGPARARQRNTTNHDPSVLMGKITSAIHPKEKRVLEMGFGMKFGWGDCLERWGPVEDGCLEGGTGRFSGVVARECGRDGAE